MSRYRSPLRRLFSFFFNPPLFPALTLALVCAACAEDTPVMASLEPRIGRAGDILSVKGTNFGDEQGSSYITIAGIPLTASSYLAWHDQEIRVKIPEFNGAGLVYVHRGRGKSNPLL
ncbi:MAG: IPT/TIG domain-containing protein, partial [Spirochaetaceae bacterium]|nr:IPT/TIG domain-containing protein [Spirochaetaceae bacterium]